ncbi:MAG: RNA methyltransferase [Bacteroidales bacterium]
MRKLKNEELNRLNVEAYHESTKWPVIIILDNIRSLNNIGSVFRTADSFRINSIYLCGITATPPHREIHKTALGATESVDWKYFEDPLGAVKFARETGFEVVLVEQIDNTTMLQNFSPKADKKYAFVFGNEINGVSDHLLDHADLSVEIPQFGTKHSFNISVSVGIVLWHVYLKLQN